MPGITTTHFALSSRSLGTPLSAAFKRSVTVSAEASILSIALASLSAANATVDNEQAIAKTVVSVVRIHKILSVAIRASLVPMCHPIPIDSEAKNCYKDMVHLATKTVGDLLRD